MTPEVNLNLSILNFSFQVRHVNADGNGYINGSGQECVFRPHADIANEPGYGTSKLLDASVFLLTFKRFKGTPDGAERSEICVTLRPVEVLVTGESIIRVANFFCSDGVDVDTLLSSGMTMVGAFYPRGNEPFYLRNEPFTYVTNLLPTQRTLFIHAMNLLPTQRTLLPTQ